MYEPAGWDRLVRRYRYASFVLDHVLGNRIRAIRRAYPKPCCVTFHLTSRRHIGPSPLCGLALTPGGEAPLASVLALLRKLRKEVRMLYLTGGEPLLHPALTTVTQTASSLGFRPLVVETNFALIDEREEVLEHCNLAVVPLQAASTSRQADFWKCDRRWVERIKANLLHYGARQKELGFRLVVKCIIGEETVDEVYDLMELCFDNNLLFAPTTTANLGLPDSSLKSLPAYERLVDYIIARKKAGAPILGNPESLRTLLAFEGFPCYPTLAPHVAPNGDVFYPCLLNAEVGGKLLFERSLGAIHRRADKSVSASHQEWHDCRLHGHMTHKWVLEHFFNRSLEPTV